MTLNMYNLTAIATFCNCTDRRYVLVTEKKSWSDAREHCFTMGARLAEIRNREEYNAVIWRSKQTGNYNWLGATDVEVEGQWVWDSNGDFVRLTKYWSYGRPLFNRRDLNCLAVWDSGMFGYNCTKPLSFVCEFSKFVRVDVSDIRNVLDAFFEETFCFSANG